MKCLCCGNTPTEYSFRVLEVHTLHVRDFGGEKLIQALGEVKEYSVCSACVSEEMRAVLFPVGRLLKKCAGFGVVMLAGLGLSLTLTPDAEAMTALRAIGPLAVFVGVSGIAGRVSEALRVRRALAGVSEEERRRAFAWRCVLDGAPKKYEDNDITYIPLDEALTPEELAVKYDLLPPIARKVCEVVNKE